jgi:hypothetical protein
MPSLIKRMYSLPLFDGLFVLAGTLGAVGLVMDAGRAYPAIEAAGNPLMKGATLAGVVLASAIVSVISTRFDQKHADDFLYHTLTKSAFIAMFTFFFTLALWEGLFNDTLGGLSSYAAIGALVAAWSLSWFYTRIRGTGV